MTTSEVIVVDASVGIKWLVDEEQDELARSLFFDAVTASVQIVTPPHFRSEVLNGIWRKVARGLLQPDLGQRVISVFADYPTLTVYPALLPQRAYELALRLRPGAIYDLIYVALAQIVDCVLWTADSRLVNALAGVSVSVRLLSSYKVEPA